MSKNGAIILYQSEDGEVNLEVQLNNETVWLNLDQMARLFQRDKSVISRHIKNVFDSGELERKSVVANFATTAKDGKTYQVDFFNLDMIISIGYRVNSHRGVQFRIWATKTLREYMIKGFVIDDERLSGRRGNYFDELLERVRKIRTSEANFYEKVRGIFSTSIDYNPNEELAKTFYKTVQNKFHYAITGQTAAEIIVTRVNAFKPNMGLVHKRGKHITKHEAQIAKNYLQELELKRLELLVEQFLSFAELQSVEQRPMYMSDWIRKLDDFIRLNDKNVLTNSGTVSHKHMQQIVEEEFDVYAQHLLDQGEATQEMKTATFKNALRKVIRTEPEPQPDDDDKD